MDWWKNPISGQKRRGRYPPCFSKQVVPVTSATTPPARLRVDSRSAGRGGTTLVETMVGTAIASFGLIGLYVANAQCLGTTRAHKEILTAEHCLEQRTEQYRAATWTQLTTASGVQGLLNDPPVNDYSLGNHAETITVSANPTVVPPVRPLVVTRGPDGSTVVVSEPPSDFHLQNSASVRIDFQESWTSAQGGRSRSRETSTIVASGGLLPR